VADKKKTRAEIVSEMASLIVGHLEAMPVEERKKKVKAFAEVVNRGGKRGRAHPKAASVFRTQRKSRRSPA
jgi:hypothetical protein